MEINFNELNLNKVRDDVNLILYNSPLFKAQDMQITNKIIERLKNVKIKVSTN